MFTFLVIFSTATFTALIMSWGFAYVVIRNADKTKNYARKHKFCHACGISWFRPPRPRSGKKSHLGLRQMSTIMETSMSSIITVDGRRLKVETGDGIEFENRYCGKCESNHNVITVRRNNKEITRIGEDIRLSGEDEVYGGVIVDVDGNVLPDPYWVTHIISNDIALGMTKDKMHYIGICGTILDNSNRENRDGITFDHKLISTKEAGRICIGCLGAYGKG